MRGKGVAPGVNAAPLGNARSRLGRLVHLLGRGGIQRHGFGALREQPGAGRVIPLPVLAQFRQPPRP